MKLIQIIILVAICVILVAVGQVMLKYGLNNNNENTDNIVLKYINKYIVIGFFIYGIAALLWLYTMSKNEISLIYPMLSLSYIISMFLAERYLKEIIPTQRWIGAIIIVIGCFVLIRS